MMKSRETGNVSVPSFPAFQEKERQMLTISPTLSYYDQVGYWFQKQWKMCCSMTRKSTERMLLYFLRKVRKDNLLHNANLFHSSNFRSHHVNSPPYFVNSQSCSAKSGVKVVLTMTTLPTRVDKLYPIIESLLFEQTYPFDLLCLFVSKSCVRQTNLKYEFPPELWDLVDMTNGRFLIQFVPQDLGPATKIIPALEEYLKSKSEFEFLQTQQDNNNPNANKTGSMEEKQGTLLDVQHLESNQSANAATSKINITYPKSQSEATPKIKESSCHTIVQKNDKVHHPKQDEILLVSVDDDVLLDSHAIEELVEAHQIKPNAVLGFMGIKDGHFVHAEHYFRFRKNPLPQSFSSVLKELLPHNSSDIEQQSPLLSKESASFADLSSFHVLENHQIHDTKDQEKFENLYQVDQLGGYRAILYPAALCAASYVQNFFDLQHYHLKHSSLPVLNDDFALSKLAHLAKLPMFVVRTRWLTPVHCQQPVPGMNIQFMDNEDGVSHPSAQANMQLSESLIEDWYKTQIK